MNPCLVDTESRALQLSQNKIYLVVIICHTRETNFQRSRLAKFGSRLAEIDCGTRAFAGDPAGCCVGRVRHGRVAAGGRLALGSSRCYKAILNRHSCEDPMRHHHYCVSVTYNKHKGY